MARTSDWVEMDVVVTVKAYPQPSEAYREAVCVAGIRIDTPEPEWVRLYPVQFRDLPPAQRFRKWEIIRVRAAKHSTDRWLETWRPDVDSIERLRQIPAGGHWAERRALVEPLLGPTMCELYRGRKGGGEGPSLGLVPVAEMLSVTSEQADGWSAKQVALLSQSSLLGNSKRKLLEKPGHTFFYKWICPEPGCPGHRQSILDWEIGEAYRDWRNSGDPVNAVRQKWGTEMCSSERELFLFVGDQHQRPGGFMVLGTFWPRRVPDRNQLTLAVG
ncbi:MAG: hypothetical protein QOI10_1790 [Solirubrobacterales bacterium]|jgi:hypothetical protein|nr:hypothetical protein [Solirubrobacterales bacterium]